MSFVLHTAALMTTACIAGLWQGLVIVLIGTAISAMMPRASAGLRHALLIAMFVGALVLPWLHVQTTASSRQGHHWSLTWWLAGPIAAIWITSTAIRAARLYLAWRHLSAVRRDAIPVQVHGSRISYGDGRRVELCSSQKVDSPSILGLGSPRLLLPDWMVPLLSESELQQIALHECEHLRRGDDWINLLLQFGMLLSPLNPALLWLNRHIRIQRELAVDAAVVERTAEPLSYAICLTRLAEQRRGHRRVTLAVTAWERQSELAQRIHALLDRPPLWTRSQSAYASGAASLAFVVLAAAMVSCPQPVSLGTASVIARADDQRIAASSLESVRPTPLNHLADLDPETKIVHTTFRLRSDSPAVFRSDWKMTLSNQSSVATRRSRASVRRRGEMKLIRVGEGYPLTRRIIPTQRNSARSETESAFVTVVLYSSSTSVPASRAWLLIDF